MQALRSRQCLVFLRIAVTGATGRGQKRGKIREDVLEAVRYRAYPIVGNLCADYQCPPTVKPNVRGAAGEYRSPAAPALAYR